MARIKTLTLRQHYKMVPKLDDDGKPIVTPVMKADGVTPRTTRGGKPIVRKVTVADKSQPVDVLCEKCRRVIKPGEKYQKATIKRTYGGSKRYRCADCPGWQPWELSSSLASRVAEIQNEDVNGDDWQAAEDAESRANEIAEMIRSLAEEKRESQSNIEEGFGHSTYQSDELGEQADNLESWADEVEQSGSTADFPEVEEEVDCENCGGDGSFECSTHEEEGHDEDCDGTEECTECGGTGQVENPEGEPSEEQLETWREEAAQAIRDALENAPDL